MAIDNWDEIRTAYFVARAGTVSGAAAELGVHHATVIRHINALEQRLGVKLFQRHARGYTATEAGVELLQVAKATDDQFTQMAGRIRGHAADISGEIIITTLPEIAELLAPVLVRFQQKHPDLVVRYLTDLRLFRLEYGEAHVAIRPGNTDQQPDNIYQRYIPFKVRLCASKTYVETHGMPKTVADFDQHYFVGHDDASFRAPYSLWLNKHVARERIIFRSTELVAMEHAVLQGIGVGFVSDWALRRQANAVEIFAQQEEWSVDTWLVTHVDLHRSPKVQALLSHLKEEAAQWPPA